MGDTAVAAVRARDLVKIYGSTRALDGLSLTVPVGSVLGVLGPNGAGKTTAVRALATLLRPDSGEMHVLGVDVRREPAKVRTLIGLAGQYAAVDERLTGRENLRIVGRLYHLPRNEVRRRADELLGRFELEHAADRPAKTYSGGMRRRLDLAASLVNSPRVLFLDEPTTGLDPRSRMGMWEVLEELVREGTTLLLTTQYLEEADRLATSIAVVDGGRVIAEGTADQLKDRIGGSVLAVRPADARNLAVTREVLVGLGAGEPVVSGSGDELHLATEDGAPIVLRSAAALEAAGIVVSELALRRPTLDDVFLALTGRQAQATEDA